MKQKECEFPYQNIVTIPRIIIVLEEEEEAITLYYCSDYRTTVVQLNKLKSQKFYWFYYIRGQKDSFL